jgi:hypothetical protein
MDVFRKLGVIDHTFQVTSFGGTGTTMLYEFLEEHQVDIPADHANWKPWKHLPVPPADDEVNDGFRAVYVFGNPMDAVLSVFRRDYQRWHVRNMREDISEPASDDWGFDEFLESMEDPFRMEKHFHEWTEANRAYPILCLHFDALWEHLPEFFAFAGLPSSRLEHFPERRERASDWTEESEYVRERLQDFYGDLWAEIQETPDFHIR